MAFNFQFSSNFKVGLPVTKIDPTTNNRPIVNFLKATLENKSSFRFSALACPQAIGFGCQEILEKTKNNFVRSWEFICIMSLTLEL